MTRRDKLAATSFGTRLLAAVTAVVVGCAVSAWLVAAAVAPGIFHDHLDQAGIDRLSEEAAHIEEAYAWSMTLTWSIALAFAVLLALAVSWFIARRVQRSIASVTASAAQITSGRYGVRVAGPGLGREFDQLTAAFNELAHRLEETEGTRRQMLSDLAHEMRTPLATLDSYFEALEDGVRELDAGTMEILRLSTHRLGRLARDITAVSHAEEGRERIAAVSIPTAELIDTAIRSVQERYDDKAVTLGGQARGATTVTADPDRMGQVLGNLLDNALRHTPTGGTVTVTSRPHGQGWVEITISDNGEGIAPEHLEHLFDRFYRADTARDRQHGGSGIGLTITRALVEAHGGTIHVRSDGQGHGARFTVQLPAIE
ncbi:sensor histidine kinase [Tomitella biformata]|uniref:sensor histidine kinase n=1 Tax=Tomitella biformata TaxID=630403 RepID=UPI000467B7BD|nr:HAMP domain-containing sensor histidine kinase [Tomitella biformata]